MISPGSVLRATNNRPFLSPNEDVRWVRVHKGDTIVFLEEFISGGQMYFIFLFDSNIVHDAVSIFYDDENYEWLGGGGGDDEARECLLENLEPMIEKQ